MEQYYSVVALYYIDGVVQDNDHYADFDSEEDAREAFDSFDPSSVYTQKELSTPESYVSVLLEKKDGDETDLLDSRDYL